jgi:UDP-N-acetylglucosamine acyltransferase
VIGLRRRGYNENEIRLIEDVYRIIYVRGYNITRALEQVEIDVAPSKLRDRILQFVRHSSAGVIRGMLE